MAKSVEIPLRPKDDWLSKVGFRGLDRVGRLVPSAVKADVLEINYAGTIRRISPERFDAVFAPIKIDSEENSGIATLRVKGKERSPPAVSARIILDSESVNTVDVAGREDVVIARAGDYLVETSGESFSFFELLSPSDLERLYSKSPEFERCPSLEISNLDLFRAAVIHDAVKAGESATQALQGTYTQGETSTFLKSFNRVFPGIFKKAGRSWSVGDGPKAERFFAKTRAILDAFADLSNEFDFVAQRNKSTAHIQLAQEYLNLAEQQLDLNPSFAFSSFEKSCASWEQSGLLETIGVDLQPAVVAAFIGRSKAAGAGGDQSAAVGSCDKLDGYVQRWLKGSASKPDERRESLLHLYALAMQYQSCGQHDSAYERLERCGRELRELIVAIGMDGTLENLSMSIEQGLHALRTSVATSIA